MSCNSHKTTGKLSSLIGENLQGGVAEMPSVHLLLNKKETTNKGLHLEVESIRIQHAREGTPVRQTVHRSGISTQATFSPVLGWGSPMRGKRMNKNSKRPHH